MKISIKRLEHWAHNVAIALALCGLVGLFGIALATMADVLGRWLFNSPIAGVRDTASLFIAVIIASAMPACILEQKHITVRFLGKFLGPRWEAVFDLFGNFATLVIFTIMTWQFWLYTNDLVVENAVTLVINWPFAPWWRIATVLIAFCVPLQLIRLLRTFQTVLYGPNPEVTAD